MGPSQSNQKPGNPRSGELGKEPTGEQGGGEELVEAATREALRKVHLLQVFVRYFGQRGDDHHEGEQPEGQANNHREFPLHCRDVLRIAQSCRHDEGGRGLWNLVACYGFDDAIVKVTECDLDAEPVGIAKDELSDNIMHLMLVMCSRNFEAGPRASNIDLENLPEGLSRERVTQILSNISCRLRICEYWAVQMAVNEVLKNPITGGGEGSC